MYTLFRWGFAIGFKDHAPVTTRNKVSFNSVIPETFFDKTDHRRNVRWTRSLSAVLRKVFLDPVDKPNERTSSVYFANHRIVTFSEPSCNATEERTTLLPYAVRMPRACRFKGVLGDFAVGRHAVPNNDMPVQFSSGLENRLSRV